MNEQTFISHSSGDERVLRSPADLVSGEVSFLVHRQPEGLREVSRVFLIRAQMSFMRAPPQ